MVAVQGEDKPVSNFKCTFRVRLFKGEENIKKIMKNLCALKEATIWSSLSTILKTRSPGMGEHGLSRVEMLEDQSKLDEWPTIVVRS